MPPVKSVEELIEFNRNDSIELRYYDQELLIEAQNKGDLTSREYLDALEKMNRLVRDEGIDKVMKEYNLDAFIAPDRLTGLEDRPGQRRLLHCQQFITGSRGRLS
ncbi:MAG: hypothetical protein ACOXZQ_01795 [Bacteroidales bacterium]